jgi:hypothetical protein
VKIQDVRMVGADIRISMTFASLEGRAAAAEKSSGRSLILFHNETGLYGAHA